MRKYNIGTCFKVTGQEFKADNGTFEIMLCLPLPNGDEYLVCKRIDNGCSLLDDRNWFNRRGNFASRLDQMAKIIKQPLIMK